MVEINEEELVVLQRKAERWDTLSNAVAKFYPIDEDTGEDLEAPGDLGDIGEIAAIHLGYL